MIEELNLRARVRRKPRGLELPSAPAASGPLQLLRLIFQPQVISLLAAALVWEGVGQIWRIPFLPPLSNVLRAAAGLIASGEIIGFLLSSLTSLALGYALAVVSAVTLGMLMGRYQIIDELVDPYLTMFLAAPKLVFIPPLYALFGIGRAVQVAVVFLGAFFVMVINTRGGMRAVDPDCVDMARLFGANERQLFWKVLLPGALPLTMAGLRLGVGRGIKGMVKGEMFIAVFGIGAMLRRYGSRFDAEHVFAIILVVVVVALLCTALVQFFERRVAHWNEPAGR